ncbi:GNAT family N-acetyltransferase [Myroides ceti]|uniref:GNAT family N-acetyltransferase n=1 Tax=Paenimyroides ceti TaxID=395087 RepID=A0ABT8CSS1_9FLAO|nr:GNAT family N-acetyltransferase [Paenimyroides ceti]MDN3706134.1 GNAT family N-acetyltransferase [Paenimyroides ceti]
MNIEQINEGHKGYFKASENDAEAGRMTYTWVGDTKFIIDHTEVNPEFNGQGVGKKMVLAAVDYARKNNLKIIPLCPFAKATFDKNQDLQDVL